MLLITMRYYQQMLTKNLWVHNKIFLSLAIAWTFLIALLCLISFEKLPDVNIRIPNADKVVHCAFHFGFTLLWFLYLQSSRPQSRYIAMVLVAVLMSLCYGALIEVLQQTFTNTRRADLKDILANVSGSLIAAVLAILLKNTITKSLFYK